MLQVLEFEYLAFLAYVFQRHLPTFVKGFRPVGNKLGLVRGVVEHRVYGCQFGVHDIVEVLDVLCILILEGQSVFLTVIGGRVVCLVRQFREKHSG